MTNKPIGLTDGQILNRLIWTRLKIEQLYQTSTHAMQDIYGGGEILILLISEARLSLEAKRRNLELPEWSWLNE